MSKPRPTCALTVSPYYLDKKKWAVCTLTVAISATGDYIWINTEVVATFDTKYQASGCAIAMSNNMRVPVFEGLKKGDRVTYKQRNELEIYGLLVRP